MLLGYARVSTQDQNLALQRDALAASGCERLFEETASGTSARLPARQELLAYARPGDVVVVWRLDRLGRSLRDLVAVVAALAERDVGLRSLREAIDTTSAAGPDAPARPPQPVNLLVVFDQQVGPRTPQKALGAAQDRRLRPFGVHLEDHRTGR